VIVVDTNVVAYLWLPGEFTGAVERLLARDAEWAVPLLWRSEFRSVLTGVIRKRSVSMSRALSIAAAAEAQFRGREYSVETAHVLSLAQRSGCSAYDCEFVALAEDLGAPLITNDRQVLRAFPELAVPIPRV
jgi:predicted nucleic acid-binding protein